MRADVVPQFLPRLLALLVPDFVIGRDLTFGRDVGKPDNPPGLFCHYAACSSAMESASSRVAMPSSISSRVIVSGGHTMITFQCVIR